MVTSYLDGPDAVMAGIPVYLRSTLSMSVDAYWKSLLCELKIMTEISQSHKTLNS